MPKAYINSIGKFLPGNSINNEEIEAYLGKNNGRSSKIKHRILKNNGIRQRYYALDRSQNVTYSNSEMAANAVKDALSGSDLTASAINLLSCATTWSDLLVPGFGNLVHKELLELAA